MYEVLLRREIVSGLEKMGFPEIEVVVQPRHISSGRVVFIRLNPAARMYYRDHIRVMDIDDMRVSEWMIENASWRYEAEISLDMLMWRGGMEMDSIAVRLLREFRHEWLNRLHHVTSRKVDESYMRLPAPGTVPFWKRWLRKLDKLTTPRIITTEEHPKGVFPISRKPVR